jgi:membrane-associated phospholipid phosphatase
MLFEAAFWLLALLLAAAFGVLAVWTSREYYLPGDRTITFGVQDLYQYPWAAGLFSRINEAGNAAVVSSVLAGLAALLAVRRRLHEAAIVVAAALTQAVPAAVSAAVERPAGQYRLMRASFDGLFRPRIYPSPGGFPSGHVFGEVLAYGLVLWLAGRVLPSPLALAVRVACLAVVASGFLAPMYAGAHWFTDELGASLLALLVIALAWRADRALRREQPLVRIEDLVGTKAAVEPRVAAVETAASDVR